MSRIALSRGKSIIYVGEEEIEIKEYELRWRRSSHAAILSTLPSHQRLGRGCGSTVFVTGLLTDSEDEDEEEEAVRHSRVKRSRLTCAEVRKKSLELLDKKESIKCIPAPLHVKRKFREKILEEPEVQLTGFKGWKNRQSKRLEAFRQGVVNVLHTLELWAEAFRTIEGRFGTAIMNYFRFIRWLMFMNFYMMAIMLCVVLVPQTVLTGAPINQTNFYNTVDCTEQYNTYIKNLTDHEGIGDLVLDVIQGTGWMEQTLLFYGVYQNRTMIGDSTTYNMSLAYILAVGASFLVSFFLIVRNTGKGMKEGVMNRDSTVNQFTTKVFCGGWDFCINVEKAAKRRHRNIFQELLGDLEIQKQIWKKRSRTLKKKIALYTIRTVINIFVLATLSASLYFIFWTNNMMLELLQSKEFDSYHPIVKALIQYMPSIAITLLNAIVPVLFQKLVLLEDYTPAFEIRMTLLRIIFLRLASLGILIISLYNTITTSSDDTEDKCGNKRWEVLSSSNGTKTSVFQNSIKCWETYVGQQFYKLVIMDFLVGVITTFLVEFPRRIIYKKFHKTNKLINMVGQQEFDLPKVVLDIVYSQTLCWLGLFFCPLTPVLGFLKCFIMFYVRKISLMRNCVQPVRPYRTSRSNSLFAAVLFLSFALSTIPLAVLLAGFNPSQSCGPFRQYNGNVVFFDTIPYLIQTWPTHAIKAFHVIGSTAFLLPAIILVCSVMYGYWIAKEANKREAELLEVELTEEGKDKQFLVAQVDEVLKHLEATQS